MFAFGFGNPAEWMILAIVALIVFGPKKLPEVGRQVGQMMREFRRVADDFTGAANSVRDEVESVYKPILTDRGTSSATVERAMTQSSFSQTPQEIVPSVPARPQGSGLTLSTLPPAAEAAHVEEPKGH